MRPWLLGSLLCCLFTIAVDGQVAPQQPPSRVLRGVATADATAVPGALITLAERGGQRSVLSDSSGRFAFPNVAPGSYTLRASKAAFMPGAYGRTWPDGPELFLEVTDNDNGAEVAVRLWRLASLEGTVFDETGQPLMGILVHALRMTFMAGRPSFSVAVTGHTDDRGRYRLWSLPPGRYVIAAYPADRSSIPRASAPATRPTYLPAFYPDQPTTTRAQQLSLACGTAQQGVDFHLRSGLAAVVAGHLSGSATGPVELTLVPAGDSLENSPMRREFVAGDTGRFNFGSVPEGQYTLSARATGDVDAFATVSVTVGSTDTSDISLSLTRGQVVRGWAEFDSLQSPASASGWTDLRVSLTSADGSSTYRNGTFDSNGRFTIEGVPPGSYVVRAIGSYGSFFRSAAWNGVDVANRPLKIDSSDVTNVVVTFSNRRTGVRGTIAPALGARNDTVLVVVFPADRTAWQDYGPDSRQIQSSTVSASGEFDIRYLPPGDYLAAAVQRHDNLDKFDPQVLDTIARRATRMTLHDGEIRTETLTAFPASDRLETPPAGAGNVASAPSREHGPYVDDAEDTGSAPWIVSSRSDVVGQNRASGQGISVDGTLVIQESNEPVPAARVSLTSSADAVTTATDEQGRFRFEHVRPGRYTLSALKPGFVSAVYGAKQPGRPGVTLVVSDSAPAVSGIVLRTAPGGTISGVVRDDDGLPVAAVTMEVCRLTTRQGQTACTKTSTGLPQPEHSDDRGIYRIYGLAPGTYCVGAIPQSGGSDLAVEVPGESIGRGRGVRILRDLETYAASATNAPSCDRVTVAAGSDAVGVDIKLRRAIMGRVTGAISSPQWPLSDEFLIRLISMDGGVARTLSRTGPTAEGKFEFPSVVPGDYVLEAHARKSIASNLPGFWVRQPVLVQADRTTIANLALERTVSINGRVAIMGAEPTLRPLPPGVVVRLKGEGEETYSAEVTKDQKFALEDILPGEYRLTIEGANGELVPVTLQSVVVNQQLLREDTLKIVPSDKPVSISVTLNRAVTELAGTLLASSGAVTADYWIVVFPTDAGLWTRPDERIFAVRPGSDGRFSVMKIRPGEYYVAAVTDIEPDEWLDPAFLRGLTSDAVRLSVRAGQRVVQTLRVGR